MKTSTINWSTYPTEVGCLHTYITIHSVGYHLIVGDTFAKVESIGACACVDAINPKQAKSFAIKLAHNMANMVK